LLCANVPGEMKTMKTNNALRKTDGTTCRMGCDINFFKNSLCADDAASAGQKASPSLPPDADSALDAGGVFF
jgi:hypothetical protein